jgi:hypothetical protein
MGYSCAIHTNSGLAHQVRNAKALEAGFKAHGIDAVITDASAEADLHVVQGPHYALDRWRYANTLYIDRAYWGDPDSLSIHWLYQGEKRRAQHADPRDHPELQPVKPWGRSIYLCDYGCQPTGRHDSVRYHPADKASFWPLSTDLAAHGMAIGKRTTALVDAAIAGLTVFTDDPHSPVYEISGAPWHRERWINNLAWHNWALGDIENGEFLNGINNGYTGDCLTGNAGGSQGTVPYSRY